MTKSVIQILDSNLDLITQVMVPHEMGGGNIIQYSKELSEYGQCKFRISSYDPQFKTYGDILVPHANHIRIQRDNITVWQGAIIENAKRTKDFIEVTAAEYLWYLGKKLVRRSSVNPSTSKADGILRIFDSGTIATAVTAIMNETITDYQNSNHALASLSLGTVENPDYPPNMTDGSVPVKQLKGPWSFGNGITAPQLTFDFHAILYILKSFGAYTYADFTIDQQRKFHFKKFLGYDRRKSVSLAWAQQGNAVDFNLPRLGQRQVNSIWGIATDTNGTILHANQQDQEAIKTDGLLEAVAPYVDIKDQATLNARIAAELPLISKTDAAATSMTMNEKAYPGGFFDVGDIINMSVSHTAITYNQPRRVVGISVTVHNTGREMVSVQTNSLLPWQVGGSI